MLIRLGGKLSLDSQSKGILKKILPGGLKGAGAGALAGLVFGGPFGLLGNAAIGTAVGMITSTDAFKDNILGKMKDGVREGGLVGEIRRAFDPLKQSAQKIGKDMLTVFDKYIVDPLSRFVNPFINQLYLALSYIPKKIGKIMEEKIGKPIQAFFVDKVLRRFNKAFGWIGKRVSGAFKGGCDFFAIRGICFSNLNKPYLCCDIKIKGVFRAFTYLCHCFIFAVYARIARAHRCCCYIFVVFVFC